MVWPPMLYAVCSLRNMSMSYLTLRRSLLTALITLLLSSTVPAGIIESADLNIIDDAGNPSNGLRFLDMSYSNGLTLSAALTNAQLTYSNARLATPSEADDLFNASSLTLNGVDNLSAGWAAGGTVFISTGANFNTSLRDALGPANSNPIFIWTDPDGSSVLGSTRDVIQLSTTNVSVSQQSITPPNFSVGWLLVSEAAAVPEPSSIMLLAAGVVGLGYRQRKRRQATPAT